MNNKLSLVVFTHNSESKIRFRKSFLNIFDELIAIDDTSKDKTKSILDDHGFKIFDSPFDGDFAKRHNFAMTLTRNNLIFFLDDDEFPDKELTESLKSLTVANMENIAGARIHRSDIAWGRKICFGEHGLTKIVRLVDRSKGQWVRKVHEYFETSGQIINLKGELIHDQKLSVESFLNKVNFYSPIDARELTREGKIFGPIQLLRPIAKFLKNYFYLLGFLEGYHGLILAYLMALQSLMIRVYQWEQDKRDIPIKVL